MLSPESAGTSEGPGASAAIVAAVDDGRKFRSGREMAAWIGLETGEPRKLGPSAGREGGFEGGGLGASCFARGVAAAATARPPAVSAK